MVCSLTENTTGDVLSNAKVVRQGSGSDDKIIEADGRSPLTETDIVGNLASLNLAAVNLAKYRANC
jgi:hypothetical protein